MAPPCTVPITKDQHRHGASVRTSICGRTACTSPSAWRRSGCARWSGSACGPTAPRKSWRSRTAIGRARRAGAPCCGSSSGAGCERAAAERELARFAQAYGPKHPKAVASLTVDQDRLLAYFDYPADHWKHLRTTNPIESTFATVRLREGVTKGAGSRTAGLVMAFKLLQVAEGHWRRLDAAELVPLVRAGVAFEDGVQVEPQKTRKKAAA